MRRARPIRSLLRGTLEGGHSDLRLRPTIGVRVLLYILVGLVVLVAVMPSMYALLWSLFGTETLGELSTRPSLRWFKVVLVEEGWGRALLYSSALAVISSTVSAFLLTLHFYFTRYAHALADKVTYVLLLGMALVPAVIFALALSSLYGPLRAPEFVLLFLGQLVLAVPMQFFIMESGRENVSDELLFAGSTLGATHLQNLRSVFWPSFKNTALAALIVGAFIAFDELVIATFLINSAWYTTPRMLWNQINAKMDPTPAAVATLLGVAFLTCVFVGSVLRRLRGVQRGRDSSA